MTAHVIRSEKKHERYAHPQSNPIEDSEGIEWKAERYRDLAKDRLSVSWEGHIITRRKSPVVVKPEKRWVILLSASDAHLGDRNPCGNSDVMLC